MSLVAKYVAGGVLIGSVFFLVYEGKASVELSLTIGGAALAALGINGAKPTGGDKP